MLLLLLSAALAADDPRALSAEAVASHPMLSAAADRTEALADEASVARRWSDPELMLGLMNVPVPDVSLEREMMTGVEVRLSQTLPSPGMPTAAADVASARVGMSEAMGDEAALALTVDVETTWWELALTRQLRALLTEQVSRAAELLEAVRARYETGGAGQGELIRLEVLRDRLSDEQGDLDRKEATLLAKLSAAVGRPDLTTETPDRVDPLAPIGDAATWLATADARPKLAVLEAQREEALAMARMATAGARPMPMGFVSVMVRPGFDEMASVGVGAPLPVASVGRGRAEASAGRSRAEAASRDAEATRREIEAGLRGAEAAWRRAWEKATRYDQALLPSAREALQTVRNDYALGKADFASLYQAEVQLIDLERAAVGARIETRTQPLAVFRLTGVRPEESP